MDRIVEGGNEWITLPRDPGLTGELIRIIVEEREDAIELCERLKPGYPLRMQLLVLSMCRTPSFWDRVKDNTHIIGKETVRSFLVECEVAFYASHYGDAPWRTWNKRFHAALKNLPERQDMTAFQVLTLVVRRLREAMKDEPTHLAVVETCYANVVAGEQNDNNG